MVLTVTREIQPASVTLCTESSSILSASWQSAAAAARSPAITFRVRTVTTPYLACGEFSLKTFGSACSTMRAGR